jgi:hypothetical protein
MKDFNPASMRRAAVSALAATFMAAASPVAAQDDGAVRHNLAIRTFMDFGHIVDGTIPAPYWQTAGQSGPDVSMLPLNRANVSVVQSVAVDNFDVLVGISGLIWWPYGGGVTTASERAMNVRPMIPVARARWRFGDTETHSGAFLLGTFSHKYNPDARNLGEYLYRSGTYPGYLWTNEGWLLMNRPAHRAYGALLTTSHFGGAFTQNFSLFMQTNYHPVGDFSPGYDFGYKHPWFEVGGGVVLNQYLALRPSFHTPKSGENTYIRVRNVAGDTAVYIGPEDQQNAGFTPGHEKEVLHRWTQKGIKVMGRAALNLNHLLPEEIRNPEDLRVFAEVAVLGWEDQPLFYEERTERMPVMFGVNLPTFKLLDLLSVQAEYHNARFNNFEIYNTQGYPIWTTSFEQDPNDPVRMIPVANLESGDNWKWSVHARKILNPVTTVYAQAASDHFRLTDGSLRASNVPVTAKPSEWYYLFRLEFTLR